MTRPIVSQKTSAAKAEGRLSKSFGIGRLYSASVIVCIKVEAMDDFEDMHNMTVTEVYEDKDYGEVARVEFNTVTVTTITPQVATEFIYDPNPN